MVLVDDDPIVLEGTEAMLEDWGCDVVSARFGLGRGGIRPRHGPNSGYYHGGLRLRGADTGLDAVAALHESLARPIPAIIVTGDTDPNVSNRRRLAAIRPA